ncbi:MAG: primase-helicase family protein [Thermoguttaceae bacterium]
MPKVTEALRAFLEARKTPANADLVARWGRNMETQVNVAAGNGEPVDGKRSTWSDGINEWFNIRIPKNAATDPSFNDYSLSFPLDVHAEGIGMTGWDWEACRSRHFAYDFDSITGHAKGVGIDDEQLAKVREAACALPYVEVRRSTGGGGIHLYVYLDAEGVPTENHTEHAALARCILGMMSAEVNFDFASQIDACGHVMWIWHRKMTAANGGLQIIKPAEKTLSVKDLPENWKDHIEVVKGRRSKVRVNQITQEDEDPFETLASSRKMIPLDDSHKAQIEALMRSGYTTLWVADHHLLQTHTHALQELMKEHRRELGLIGIFKTISEGRDKGTPNCFLFPLSNGGWRVFRFSPGINEADTWTQSDDGWTTCYFNRYPTLASACKLQNGIEEESGGFVFAKAEDAIKAAESIGQKIDMKPAELGDRKVTLKSHKDGRLIVHIEQKKGQAPLDAPGWSEKKGKWVRIFDVKLDQNDDGEDNAGKYDNVIRCLESASREHSGWVSRKGGEWVRQPATNVKMILQSLGNPKTEAEEIMGNAVIQGWRLVNLPFREEYPGNRQWNIDAAQFAFKPAELSDDEAPYHPHWDMIYNHIGTELTPALKDLAWAQRAGIRTGADYLRAWSACAFRCPFEPTPYLFLFGTENCGKSIFFESLQLLVTKGVVKADKALGNTEFNGELAGAIICAVEEKDISKFPGALAKIKDWVTGRTICIRKMRHDAYDQPNSTHWVQTANHQSHCPVFKGDTRITVIRVPDLLEEQVIAKPVMEEALIKEAPHFLYTLMHLELPPMMDRLRIPVVATSSKKQVEEDNRTPIEIFIDENCSKVQGALEITFKDFYPRFYEQVPATEKHNWPKGRVQRDLPLKHTLVPGPGNKRFMQGLVWKQAEEAAQ